MSPSNITKTGKSPSIQPPDSLIVMFKKKKGHIANRVVGLVQFFTQASFQLDLLKDLISQIGELPVSPKDHDTVTCFLFSSLRRDFKRLRFACLVVAKK